MEAPTRDLRTRRWIGRLIRTGLIAVAVVFVASWGWMKVSGGRNFVFSRANHGSGRTIGGVSGVESAVTDASLGAGDLRIYNRDSTVDLVLRGSQVLAGLSPMTIAKVQADMAKGSDKETSGLGGMIASTVKKTVASTIGTHVAYPVANIRDIRFEDGQLLIEHTNGTETRLFGSTKVNGRDAGKLFEETDADRFIEAVRARRRELRGR